MSAPDGPRPEWDAGTFQDEADDEPLDADYCTMCGVLMGPDGLAESHGALCVECCECPKCLNDGSNL